MLDGGAARLFIVHCRPAVIESQCLYGSTVDGGHFSKGPPIATASDLACWGFSFWHLLAPHRSRIEPQDLECLEWL